MKEVRSAPPAERATVGRLSTPVRYRPCADGCASPSALPAELATIGGRVAQASGTGIDPDALQAAAVLDLVTGARENSLDRSIRYLEMANRLDPSSDRFVDLSAALIERAHRTGDAASAVAAVDAALRATHMDSASAEAQFNLAIALRDLGLFSAAQDRFRRAASLDPESDWAAEATSAQSGLAIDTVRAPSDSVVTPETMDAFARLHPNEARGMAWDRLGAWGSAFIAKNMTAAERHLAIAEAAGRAIAESHVDPSILDATRAIRRSPQPVKLARAHQAYVEGLNAGRARDRDGAERAYTEATKLARSSPALALWAEYGAGNNRLAFNDEVGTEGAMRRILASPESKKYPALAARAWWALGVVLLRRQRMDEGRAAAIASRDLYEQLGELEYRAAMIGLAGEAASTGGDAKAAYAYFADALRMLRNYPTSTWRHNILLLLARAATTDGYVAAAELIEAEDDRASAEAKRTTALVETQLTRIQRRKSLGDSAGAHAAVAEARKLATQLKGAAKVQLEMELGLAEMEIGGSADRRIDGAAALDRAVAYFTDAKLYPKLLRAYVARAEWRARAGDMAKAESDLDAALTIYEERRGSARDANERALLTQQARRVVDALTLLRVHAGDATGAWTARERVRAGGMGAGMGVGAGTTVELALIGDSLVTLTNRAGMIAAKVTAVSHDELTESIERVNAALERGSPEQVWGPLLSHLGESLLKSAALTPADDIVTIIAEGPVSRAPFAALRDARGRYLIDDHALRFASSLHQAALPRTPLSATPRALLVADPAIDRRAFPGLTPLTGAAAEVDSIGRMLPRSRVLAGAAADTMAVRASVISSEIFHFAGHALFDDARPQASQLAMGARGWAAQSIASMRLDSLRLVVLSACETNRAGGAGAAGFLGLAESFMAAGAGGVIGSTWKVDDAATTQLMVKLYEGLLRTRDPVIALRDAQRAMRGSSPSAWAGFRYVGR